MVKLSHLSLYCLAGLPALLLSIAAISPPSPPLPTRSAPSAWSGKTPVIGAAIGPWRVSSDYGPRDRPCHGCSAYHRGVDVAAPVGSPVYAVGDRAKFYQVFCEADMIRQAMGEWSVETLHASQCSPGKHRGGSLIGLSGTGGTGPHYHIQLRDERLYAKGQDGRVPPPTSLIREVVAGTPATTTAKVK